MSWVSSEAIAVSCSVKSDPGFRCREVSQVSIAVTKTSQTKVTRGEKGLFHLYFHI